MNNSRLNSKIKRESWAATRANASLNNLSPTDVDALIAQYLIDNPVGGGGSTIIGEYKSLYTDDVAGVLEVNEETWFKTGTVALDVANYPDAKQGSSVFGAGTEVSVAGQDTNPRSLTSDGTHVWMLGTSTNRLYKYTTALVYTGTSFSTSVSQNVAEGVTWNGSAFVVIQSNGDAFRYSAAGVFIGFFFAAGAQAALVTDIFYLSGIYWVVSRGNRRLYRYNSSGVYQSFSFSTSSQTSLPTGVTYAAPYYWVTAGNTGNVFAYSTAGVNQPDLTFSTTPLLSTYGTQGITFAGGFMYIVSSSNDKIVQFTNLVPYVGDTDIRTSADVGQPYYVRVK